MEPNVGDLLWITVAAGLVFLMQAGFTMLEAGFTRSKNSINVAIKNLADVGISSVGFWAVGFGLMFGTTWQGLTGRDHFLFLPNEGLAGVWEAAFFLFQLMFAATCTTIVSGAVAERMRFAAYLVVSTVITVVVYPVFGHWAWGGALFGSPEGWLVRRGFVDFAGSTVVHSMGGWVALAAVLIIGPRKGRFEEGARMQGSNIPIAVLGALLLWLGWFGFNGGSTLALDDQVPGIILRTSLAGAAGLMAAMAAGWVLTGRADVSHVINGSIAGLVAITANCHAVTEAEALIIGAVGGLVMLGSLRLLEQLRIDDVVGAIPVHLAAGIWGTLAVGLFGDPALLGTGLPFWEQVGVQTLGVAVAGVWGFGVSYLLLRLIDRFFPLRVPPEAEEMGLNVAEHGATTELYDLFTTLTEQARTGDLSLRVPEDPFTEVGQIARAYNRVMDRLQETTVDRDEYVRLLSVMRTGLCVIDRDGRIAPHYSRAFLEIFELSEEEVSRLTFLDILKSRVPERTYTSLSEFLEVMWAPHVDEEVARSLSPFRELDLFCPHGHRFTHKVIRAEVQRIWGGEAITHLLFVIEDITEQALLERELQEKERRTASEMEMFYHILHTHPVILDQFLQSVEEDLTTIAEICERESDDPERALSLIYRYVHSIKGDAYAVGLDPIGETAHQIEEHILKMRESGTCSEEALVDLGVKMGEIRTLLERALSLKERLLAFHRESTEAPTSDPIVFDVERFLERIRTEEGKRVRVDFSAYHREEIPLEIYKPVKDMVLQCVRNAVAHGIEDEAEREARGKAAEGCIRISTSREEEVLRIIVEDDGRGMDLARLRARLLERGLIAPDAPPREVLRALFTHGASSRDEADALAGRGAGLPLIGTLVRRLGGRIALTSTPGRGTRIVITLPCSPASHIPTPGMRDQELSRS
ncbi:multi-sensor signal transduction histidine kinase [Spirochaeta thermophila DSM 6578]|uniref:histidine kinase n=1 Tax=Winmispira thermophila (strain ATCC 700085 / DSM 6578 / Z-1203) TaxID=869211 RepID=G0GDY2_WINT7|nr:ammonium transporter [Spirochaeta thermophila]AEJ60614.1 multi-sensor signal transduction histidine kinase [Spirochaeta thermophila DSM 6578]